jgi:hypothetical protein
MINLGIKYLLPSNWKAVAWVDADVEFDNPYWATYALRVLNNGKDFVQLFTNVFDMDIDEQILNIFTGFGYQYSKNFKKGKGLNYWHPGFAWACTRKAYEQIGGILDEGILGSGDNIMCHSFIKQAPQRLKKGMTNEYMDFVKDKQDKFDGLNLGYIPGTIRHFYHGKKENRNYYGREDILIRHKYDPNTFIKKDSKGLIIPSETCPKEFLKDIMDYFEERNEDEGIDDAVTPQKQNSPILIEAKELPQSKPPPSKPPPTSKTDPVKLVYNPYVRQVPVQSVSQFKRLSFL